MQLDCRGFVDSFELIDPFQNGINNDYVTAPKWTDAVQLIEM
jgi:hypothetical protein